MASSHHSSEGTTVGAAGAGGRSIWWWHRPPRVLVHLPLVPMGVMLLWTYSSPGEPEVVGGLAWIGVMLAWVLMWVTRAVAFGVSSILGRAEGGGLWLMVAPLAGVVVVGVLWLDLPLRARWALSRGSFEERVEAIRPSRYGPIQIERGGRVGYYDVHLIRVADGAVLFATDRADGLLGENWGGFAYLPDHQNRRMSELFPDDPRRTPFLVAPELDHLSGNWYTWTASHDTW